MPTAPMAGTVSSGMRPRGPTSRATFFGVPGCGRRRFSAADTAYAMAAR